MRRSRPLARLTTRSGIFRGGKAMTDEHREKGIPMTSSHGGSETGRHVKRRVTLAGVALIAGAFLAVGCSSSSKGPVSTGGNSGVTTTTPATTSTTKSSSGGYGY